MRSLSCRASVGDAPLQQLWRQTACRLLASERADANLKRASHRKCWTLSNHVGVRLPRISTRECKTHTNDNNAVSRRRPGSRGETEQNQSTGRIQRQIYNDNAIQVPAQSLEVITLIHQVYRIAQSLQKSPVRSSKTPGGRGLR